MRYRPIHKPLHDLDIGLVAAYEVFVHNCLVHTTDLVDGDLGFQASCPN